MVVKRVISLVIIASSLCMGNPCPNLIDSLTVEKNRLQIVPHAGFKKKYLKENFFALYEPDINLELFDYSVVTMPFIMNVISIVWISGNIYWVDEMDRELYDSLERVKKVFKIMYPGTSWNGELRAHKLVDHPAVRQTAEKRTALLFSGGIDSTSTALGHLDKKQLLITAWGHWDLPLHETALWQTRKKKIDSFAKSFGNETATIRSNYSSFLNWEYLSQLTPEIIKWRLGAVEGIGWAGLTAPLLLTKGYPTLRIPSSHTWYYPYPAAANPCVDNNLLFCGLRVIHDQFDMTRLAKIAFICAKTNELISHPNQELRIKHPFLKICSFEKKSDANCGTCRKCISSAIGFYALGEDPQAYGIDLTLSEALEKTVELLAPEKLNFYTILYFKEVQSVIRSRIALGKSVNKKLVQLLEIDLESKCAFDTENQRKLDWPALLACLPAHCQDSTCPAWLTQKGNP